MLRRLAKKLISNEVLTLARPGNGKIRWTEKGLKGQKAGGVYNKSIISLKKQYFPSTGMVLVEAYSR